MSDFSKDQQIATFLAVCRTASLATVDREGLPCNANVQFASDAGWRLVWVSGASAVHSQNVVDRPDAAITIYAHDDRPEVIHGLQLRGHVELLDDEAAKDALDLYAEKYPFVTEPPYHQAIARQRFYRFTPTWLRWIDNREGFGRKFEKTL